jgi:ornithine cyclodeaminase
VLVPGLVRNIPAYSVKVNAKYPDQHPSIRGILLLHDLATGALLAVMDATYITAVRTGLGGALAAEALARPDARAVAVIGAGVQGEFQLRYLSLVRAIRRVTVFDIVPGRAQAFAQSLSSELGLPVIPSASVANAVAEADIILAATYAREPFLFPDIVRKGVHIATIGPDEQGKCEVSADLIRQATFICDDRELAVSMGAIGGARLGPEAIHAELGEVLAGTRSGRIAPEQITVYGTVGLAFQDLVAAWQVYLAAQTMGNKRKIDFLRRVIEREGTLTHALSA